MSQGLSKAKGGIRGKTSLPERGVGDTLRGVMETGRFRRAGQEGRHRWEQLTPLEASVPEVI